MAQWLAHDTGITVTSITRKRVSTTVISVISVNIVHPWQQLVGVSDLQQRVSGAVNDFKSLSQEVMVTLRYSGKDKRSRRRRHNYRVYYDIV